MALGNSVRAFYCLSFLVPTTFHMVKVDMLNGFVHSSS